MLLTTASIYGQSGQVYYRYSFRHFTTADGLPQMQCLKLFQDSKGFIWVGTKFGAARYDGKEIKVFSPKTGSAVRHVHGLTELNNGMIVLSGVGDKFCLVSGDNFRNVEIKGKHTYTSINGVFPINDSLFVVSAQRKRTDNKYYNDLYLFSSKTTTHIYLGTFTNQLPIYIDDSGRIITVTNRMVNNVDSTFLFLYNYKLLLIDKITIPSESDVLANFTHQGMPVLYYSAYLSVLYAVGIKNNKLDTIEIRTPINEMIHAYALLPHGENTWFYGSQNNYLGVVSEIDSLISPIIVNSMIIDNEGNLWAGGEGGVYCFFHLAVKELEFNNDPGVYDGVWSMASDRKGNFIYAGFGRGFFLSDNNNKTWHKPEYIAREERKYPGNFIYGTFGARHTKAGTWIFPGRGGFISAKNNNYTTHFFRDFPTEIFATLEDSINGIVYISHFFDVYAFHESNNHLECILKCKGDRHITTLDMEFDKYNRIVRVGRGAPSYYDEGEWHDLPACENIQALSVCRDYRGNLWFARGDELSIYDYKSCRTVSTKVPTRMMILDLTVWDKWLIIGGGMELIFFDLEEFYRSGQVVFKRFDKGSGVNIHEGGQNSFYHHNDGSIFWPCSDKIIQFFPNEMLSEQSIPKPVILSSEASDMKSTLLLTDSLLNPIGKLPHAFRNIQFSFTSSAMGNNSMLMFRYRLLGFSEKWSQPSTSTFANFLNIGPGTYHFEVQSSFDGLKWSESSFNQPITIPHYLYEYRTFQVITLIIIVLATVVLISLILRAKRCKHNLRQEQQYKMNQLILMNLRSKYIPHFSGNVFNNIDYLIENGEYDEASEYITLMSRLFDRLLKSADTPSATLLNEIDFVANYLKLEKLRFKDKLNYYIDIVPEINTSVKVPNMIIHTLVENAVKHGIMEKKGKGNIWITTEDAISGVKLIVKDDGVGREEAKKYNLDSSKSGLAIVREQIILFNELNKSKMSLVVNDLFEENGNAAGTEFIVYMPYNYTFEYC